MALAHLDPRMVRVWAARGGVASLGVAAVVLAAELGIAAGGDLPWPRGLGAAAVLAAGAVLSWALARARYRSWRYEVAERTLELHHGVVVRSHSAIPYFRVQHVDVTQGPVERALGVARLVVHTASAATDAAIPGVAADRADALRDVILERTGAGDAV